MTEFLFVRHGETTLNTHPEIVGGRANSAPLSRRGYHQGDRIGHYFRDIRLNPDAVYSSGAIRADTTAMCALGAAGLPHQVQIDPLLQEMTHGDFEGKLRSDVYTPEALAQYQLNTMDGKLPGGESVRDVQERMWNYVMRAHNEYPEGEILVFSHGLAIRALAGLILAQTKHQILGTSTDNVSLTQIIIENDSAYVDFVGENVITE